MDLAMMQDDVALRVDEKRRIERIRIPRLKQRCNDMNAVGTRCIAEMPNVVAVQTERSSPPAQLGRRVAVLESGMTVGVHLRKDDDVGTEP